ncbi:hypothetical protein ACWXVL_01070 [Mycoplasma sp. 128]|uniref:hypothetical protein n=1 Tax=Mycoplasma sp. 3341 TaxID=3447506 RepID=UPI003F6604A2
MQSKSVFKKIFTSIKEFARKYWNLTFIVISAIAGLSLTGVAIWCLIFLPINWR